MSRDELVLCTPALERLECVPRTFSDEPFVRLSVKDFRRMLCGAENFLHEAGLEHLLGKVGQGGMALTQVEIFSKSGEVRNRLAGLASACAERGVTLIWAK